MNRFVKSAYGAQVCESNGFVVRQGVREYKCACGCGNVVGYETGYVVNVPDEVSNRQFTRTYGVKTSNVNVDGVY